jgi:hypothetical protein
MRRALLILALSFPVFACDDGDKPRQEKPTRSKLERPALPRPPGRGLPDDLRPPR